MEDRYLVVEPFGPYEMGRFISAGDAKAAPQGSVVHVADEPDKAPPEAPDLTPPPAPKEA